jgi:two-component system, cell cycle sensor histidine kinase and response regulator CckA
MPDATVHHPEAQLNLDEAERVASFCSQFPLFVGSLGGSAPLVGQRLDEMLPLRHAATLAGVIAGARRNGFAKGMLYGGGPPSPSYRVTMRVVPASGGITGTLRVAPQVEDDAVTQALGEAFAQNLTDMVMVVGTDLRLHAFNPAMAAGSAMLLGRPVRPGDLVTDLMQPESLPAWRALFDRAARGEAVVDDLEIVVSSGKRILYELSLNPLLDEAGSIDRVLIVSRNVTRHRDDHADAVRAAERRRALLDAFPEAITVFDRAGTIVDFKGARDIPIPMAPEALIGKNLRSMTHVPVEEILALLEKAFASRQTEEIEYEAVVRGEVRYRVATLRAISDAEAVWIARDVTADRVRARALAQADRLASLGTLVAGITHELNNPLHYVSSNVEFVGEYLAAGSHGTLPVDVRDALTDSTAGLRAMRSIVASLRAFATADEPTDVAVDVRAAIDTALHLVGRELLAHASVHLDLATEAHVKCPSKRLTQVLVNLLLNASQALRDDTREKNEIKVTVKACGEARVAIEVSDNGRGIPFAIRSRIFDPFFTTRTLGQGTGLGLAIAQNIVRAALGEIQVESIEGVGSVFRVVLPAAVAAVVPTAPTSGIALFATAPPSARSLHPAVPGARVLVVDDDDAMLRSITRSLGGFDVQAASSAAEALTHLENATFDLVLSDVVMPEQTGVDLYKAVAARWPGREASIVLMSGGVLSERDRAFLATSQVPLLAKPFDAARLDEHLARVKGHRERPSAP